MIFCISFTGCVVTPDMIDPAFDEARMEREKIQKEEDKGVNLIMNEINCSQDMAKVIMQYKVLWQSQPKLFLEELELVKAAKIEARDNNRDFYQCLAEQKHWRTIEIDKYHENKNGFTKYHLINGILLTSDSVTPEWAAEHPEWFEIDFNITVNSVNLFPFTDEEINELLSID